MTSATAFVVDFLPVIRRTLTRSGFVIDHVHYFANVLRPWIARRAELEKFVIRRDPRDISRVWVLDPGGEEYVEVPYRTLSRPPVTLWEHRQAVARLRQQGRDQVDEQALFAMIEQMRVVAVTASESDPQDPPRTGAAPPPPWPGRAGSLIVPADVQRRRTGGRTS